MQTRLTEAGSLLNSEGRLNETGYAKTLIKSYDRSAIKANPLRIKEWDYYLIYNQNYGIALTIADNSYMGLMSVSFLDFVRRKETTKSVMTAMPMGHLHLPSTSELGNVSFRNAKIDISFFNDGSERRLLCRFPNFQESRTLEASLRLYGNPRDSMVIATPFAEDSRAFYYNQKINCMRASGTVKIGDWSTSFRPDDSFGGLDWGRGVWTYRNTWYWSSASGLLNGHRFGWNLGYGFGDTSAASENMLFYDGTGHKLDRVTFEIPKDGSGRDAYLRTWHFRSSDERLQLTFEPILDRHADTDAGVIASYQHQVFGKFSGNAVLDDGTVLWIKDFMGFAEKVTNRW